MSKEQSKEPKSKPQHVGIQSWKNKGPGSGQFVMSPLNSKRLSGKN